MPFSAANPALAEALTARGYTQLTPVQEAVLAPEAAARDLLVSAQTGSGKTVAYGLAFAPSLLGGDTRLGRAGAPLALIVAPTRELAMQVQRELAWLYAPAGARITACIGGMDARAEARSLDAGAHIVVGTPGRLCDHLRRGRLDLSALRVLVLDEADEMLDLGFREELEQLLAEAPDWRRTLLFSATIAREIVEMAKTYQRDALRIDTLVKNQAHADIDYRAVRVVPRETEHAIVNVLRFVDSPTAMVFCATRDGVRHLHASLTERGFTSVALSGELTQNERSRALQLLRDGQARVCVATDVAARGLDLPDLGLVVHADLPTNKATLLHRSGRTGRAGRKGMCVVIVPAHRVRAAETLFSNAKVSPFWSGPPPADEIRALDAQRLLADPILTEPAAPEDLELARALLDGRTAEEVAAALIRMHRARLPAPEEVTDLAGPQARPVRPAGTGPVREVEAAAPGKRAPRAAQAWLSVNVGRQAKADPKWVLPLLCRLGGVEKADIGAIRVLDRETRFELALDAVEDFLANVQMAGNADVRVSRADAPPVVAKGGFVRKAGPGKYKKK